MGSFEDCDSYQFFAPIVEENAFFI